MTYTVYGVELPSRVEVRKADGVDISGQGQHWPLPIHRQELSLIEHKCGLHEKVHQHEPLTPSVSLAILNLSARRITFARSLYGMISTVYPTSSPDHAIL